MQKLIFPLALCVSIFLVSCTKEPTACIIAPSSAEVFEPVTLRSCSEDAESYSWNIEIDDFLQGTRTTTYNESSTTVEWGSPGTYSIELEAKSKNERKTDKTSTAITINDICYTCLKTEDNFTQTRVECFSEWTSREFFDIHIIGIEGQGFACGIMP